VTGIEIAGIELEFTFSEGLPRSAILIVFVWFPAKKMYASVPVKLFCYDEQRLLMIFSPSWGKQ